MTTYDEAVAWMDTHSPFLLTLVLNLGKPVETTKVPDMTLGVPQDNPDGWALFLNPAYVEALTAEEAAGLLLHQALHAVLGHPGERVSGQYPDKEILHTAQEVIINDRLARESITLPRNFLYGPDIVGMDTSPYDTTTVYNLLLVEQENMQEPAGGEGEEQEEQNSTTDASTGSGSAGEVSTEAEQGTQASSTEGTSPETSDSMGDTENTEASEGAQGGSAGGCSLAPQELSPEAAQRLQDAMLQGLDNAQGREDVSEELLEDLGCGDDSVTKSSMAGTGFQLTEQQASEKMGTSLELMKLLAEVNPDILRKPGPKAAKYRSSWHSPRRSLAHMHPEVMVPQSVRRGDPDRKAREGNNKPYIVLALDLSGSIPGSMAQRMVSIANKIPTDLVEVDCCTFSTEYVPFNITSKNNKLAGGGTDFSAVEEFVRECAKKRNNAYPRSVVCITDGQADFYSMRPTSKHLDHWTWLLIHKSNTLWVKGVSINRKKYLSDFL